MSSLRPREVWSAQAGEHARRVDALTARHRARRAQGVRHPVEDFLFEYYAHRPAQLRRWHPGPGVRLEDAPEYAGRSGYLVRDGVAEVDLDAVLDRRGGTVRFVHGLLTATLSRPADLGCFGWHEWAMVYRLGPGERRHEDLPLRLGQSGTDAVLAQHRVRCSHADAFRFFTGPARELNRLQPTREGQAEQEQPGCLHAGMDLYKWCFKLTPLIPSDLTLYAFELARRARELDMQASPYDVRAFGLMPVAVETPAGRAEYVRRQRDLMTASNALRERLVAVCEQLLASTSPAARPGR